MRKRSFRKEKGEVRESELKNYKAGGREKGEEKENLRHRRFPGTPRGGKKKIPRRGGLTGMANTVKLTVRG